ncbi:unnamed protein product [Lota lota]
MASVSLGADELGADELGAVSLGADELAAVSLGADELGAVSLGADGLGHAFNGFHSFSRVSAARAGFGEQQHAPVAVWEPLPCCFRAVSPLLCFNGAWRRCDFTVSLGYLSARSSLSTAGLVDGSARRSVVFVFVAALFSDQVHAGRRGSGSHGLSPGDAAVPDTN